MNLNFKMLFGFSLLLLIASLVYLTISKPQKPKPPNPACANMDITGIKEGLIARIEDKGRIVYMSKDWDLIPMEEKERLGFWLALCRSPNERVELRDAETKKKIREFVIDLHYKMSNGLPINP